MVLPPWLVPDKIKSRPSGGRARSAKLDLEARRTVIALVQEACAAGARREAACALMEVSPRTLQRWQEEGTVKADGRQAAAQGRAPGQPLEPPRAQPPPGGRQPPGVCEPAPQRESCPRLTTRENTSPRNRPATASCAMRGSGSNGARSRRLPTAARSHCAPPARTRSGAGTSLILASLVAGQFFYLYLILDVFSRQPRGLGGLRRAGEPSRPRSCSAQGSFSREGVGTQALVLHSDNGSPMKGATLLATLQRLGVVPSFSRPVGQATTTPTRRPCSKPATTTPASPSSPAKSPEQARTWVAGFVHWYNEEHRHSGIRFVTPGQRHRGERAGDPGPPQGPLRGRPSRPSRTLVSRDPQLGPDRLGIPQPLQGNCPDTPDSLTQPGVSQGARQEIG